MPNSRLLYYITDRTAFAPDEATRRNRLLGKIAEAARAGIDYIQLREKDLPTRALESLSRDAVALLRQLRVQHPRLTTKLLINSRTDIALAAGADGVHLRSDDVSPEAIRSIWTKTHVETAALGCPAPQGAAPLIGVSCHSPFEVNQAANNGVTFAVFAPVFGKNDAPASQPAGLSQLREACKAKIPALALGGITLENAESCLEAGAAGIAAIRLFQANEIAGVVARLRRD